MSLSNSDILLIHPAAIQLCARKTAANTGDLRKAFDICKRGLDLAEEEAKKKISFTSLSLEETIKHQQQLMQLDNSMPKVMISHIAKICSTAFGGTAVQRVKTLNFQQKAVLCSLVLGEKTKAQSLSVHELFEHYGVLCAKDKLFDSLKISEFTEVINTLEACGAVNVSKTVRPGRIADGKRISAAIQEIDLLRAVDDVEMLKRTLTASRN